MMVASVAPNLSLMVGQVSRLARVSGWEQPGSGHSFQSANYHTSQKSRIKNYTSFEIGLNSSFQNWG